MFLPKMNTSEFFLHKSSAMFSFSFKFVVVSDIWSI